MQNKNNNKIIPSVFSSPLIELFILVCFTSFVHLFIFFFFSLCATKQKATNYIAEINAKYV